MKDDERAKGGAAGRPPGNGRALLALVAAWAVPGLGHVLLGRVYRGLFFSALIFASFSLGLAHDGRLALRDAQNAPVVSALQVVANLGVGAADVAARWVVYGEPAYSLRGGSAQPDQVERRRTFRDRDRSALSMFGTAYLWTAGLMNLLLLFDVWDIARNKETLR